MLKLALIGCALWIGPKIAFFVLNAFLKAFRP
jgi:hypothetical protein